MLYFLFMVARKKKVTLDTLAAMLAQQNKTLGKHGELLADHGQMVEHIVKHMATKDDVREVLGHVVAMHDQMNNMEAELTREQILPPPGDPEAHRRMR